MKLVSLLMIFVTSLSFAQNKSVLYIGNSYTYSNNLPLMVYNLGLSNNDTITYDSSTPGGQQFNQHVKNPTTLSKITSRKWDVVILQEQSQIPALPLVVVGPALYSPTYAVELNDLIKANDSCSQVVFFMTWGRKEGDASNCIAVPAVCTFEGMQGELRKCYLEMAEENHAIIAPAGIGFKNVIKDKPEIELFVGDGSHPNVNGSYLSACIMYASIYQKSPIGNSYTAGLTAEMANYLQEVAHYTVFDSLSTWRIGIENLRVDFSYANDDLTYTFTNVSENETTLHWEIAGIIYDTENPVHTFPGAGMYKVILTASNGCDTLNKKIDLNIDADGTAGIQHVEIQIDLYPNPVNDVLTITTNSFQEKNVQLIDMTGRILLDEKMSQTLLLNASHLETGSYFIKIEQTVQLFMKR